MSTGAEIGALLAETAWIRALARSLVADVELAEDLAQDAWVAALERPPRADRSVRGWLAVVLRNRSSDLGRERGWRARRELAAARDEALPSAHDVVEKAALQRALVGAVLELDEPRVQGHSPRPGPGEGPGRGEPCERANPSLD